MLVWRVVHSTEVFLPQEASLFSQVSNVARKTMPVPARSRQGAKKKAKQFVTRTSHVVTHRSTILAQSSLTAEV